MNSQPYAETPIAEVASLQGQSPLAAGSVASDIEPTPASGRRQALRDLRRELTDEDLASPGVQKMLLDDLERADSECELLTAYVTRFHDTDKRAAVLDEKLRTQTALEIAFGVGVGLGCAIMGMAPSFWATQPLGALTLVVGFLLTVGATVARMIKG